MGTTADGRTWEMRLGGEIVETIVFSPDRGNLICGKVPPLRPHFAIGVEHDVPVPPGVAEAVRAAGGLNVYGDPNFRIVWSEGRHELQFGEWLEYGGDGSAVETDPLTGERRMRTPISRKFEARSVPKYVGVRERFILEEWHAAALYGPPSAWPDRLGPYPARGDYEMLKVLEACDADCKDSAACQRAGHDRKPFAPDVKWARMWIEGYTHFKEHTPKGKLLAAQQDMRKRREERERAEMMDFLKSRHRAFGAGSVWTPVQGGRDGIGISAA